MWEALHIIDGVALTDSDSSDDDIRERAPRITRTRTNSCLNLSDDDYKLTYRFTKENVGRLTELLWDDLTHRNNRGCPVSPRVKVELTLCHFAGNTFYRIAGQSHNIGRTASRDIIRRVTDAILRHKEEFVYLPSAAEMRNTATEMEERFELPDFGLAIDGIHMRLAGAPQGIPHHHCKQHYWCRKQFYSINCMVSPSLI